MWQCKHCKKRYTFSLTSEKANHTRWCDQNPKYTEYRKDLKEKVHSTADTIYGELLKFKVACYNCREEFIVEEREKLYPQKEKYFCDRACANAQGGIAKAEGLGLSLHYRTLCFKYHKKQCVICEEKNIVEVHHLDGDHHNNSIENLIPICPTHHKYWHSRHRRLIEPKVQAYATAFRQRNKI